MLDSGLQQSEKIIEIIIFILDTNSINNKIDSNIIREEVLDQLYELSVIEADYKDKKQEKERKIKELSQGYLSMSKQPTTSVYKPKPAPTKTTRKHLP